MQQKTLYERLQKAETINERLKTAVTKFADELVVFNESTDSEAVKRLLPDMETLPKISVPDYQRKIIESSTANHILLNALRREQTVIEKLEELSERYVPGPRFLPRRKNYEHNHEVEQLAELVQDANAFETRGFFSLDNFMSGASLGAALAYVFGGGIVALRAVADVENTQNDETALLAFLPAATAFCYGLAFSLIGKDGGKYDSDIVRVKEQANYIDTKIEELYPRKTSIIVPSEKPVVVEEL